VPTIKRRLVGYLGGGSGSERKQRQKSKGRTAAAFGGLLNGLSTTPLSADAGTCRQLSTAPLDTPGGGNGAVEAAEQRGTWLQR